MVEWQGCDGNNAKNALIYSLDYIFEYTESVGELCLSRSMDRLCLIIDNIVVFMNSTLLFCYELMLINVIISMNKLMPLIINEIVVMSCIVLLLTTDIYVVNVNR